MQDDMTEGGKEQRLVDLYRELTGATERQAASVYMYQLLRGAGEAPAPVASPAPKGGAASS